MVNNPPANAGDTEVMHSIFNPWVGKFPLKKEMATPPVFLPGECYGQRSLAGYIVHGFARVGLNLETTPSPSPPLLSWSKHFLWVFPKDTWKSANGSFDPPNINSNSKKFYLKQME